VSACHGALQQERVLIWKEEGMGLVWGGPMPTHGPGGVELFKFRNDLLGRNGWGRTLK